MADIDFYGDSINNNNHQFGSPISSMGMNRTLFSLFEEKNGKYKEICPIHHAVATKDKNLLNILLKTDMSINQINKDGFTALHMAIEYGNEGIIQILLSNGAQADIKDIFGRTALFLTLCTNCLDRRKTTRIAKLILDSQTDSKALLNECTHSGEFALYCAVQNNYEEMVLLFLQYGANINAKDRNGKSSLYLSVQLNKVKIVKFLLINGAKVNDKVNNGMAALHEAVRQRAEKCVQLLISYGAEVNTKDIYGITPLYMAVQLYYLDEKKMGKILRFLLNKGADINDCTNFGETAFHCAIINGNEKLVRLFLEYGADLNSKNLDGKSPLHYAIQYSNKNIVKLLLNKGAVIDNTTSDGKLALHVAVAVEDENMIKLLLEYNADVNSTDKSGKTPLSLAFEVAHMRNIYNPWNGFYPNHLEMGCNNNIFEVLIKYIAKLKHISEENLRLIRSNEKLSLFYSLCLGEMKEMKKKNVCDNISLYKVLTKSDDALIGYSRNASLFNIISSDLYEYNFPIYYQILKNRFLKANKKKELLEQSTKIFTELIKPYTLPETVKNQIFSFLSCDDLRNFNKISGKRDLM